MILAALGVGAVVGCIIGAFLLAPATDEGNSSLDVGGDDEVLLPVGACESAFTDEDDAQYRDAWFGELDESQRKGLYIQHLDEILGFCTDEDETLASAQELFDATAALEEANRRLLDAENELQELRAQGDQGSSRVAELEALVVELEAELEEVRAERDELQEELNETIVELEHQIEQTRRYRNLAEDYRDESIDNQWDAFVNMAKLDICNERWTANARETCWDTVDSVMSVELEAQYSHCVRSDQMAPILMEFTRNEERPPYTRNLSDLEEGRFLRNWSVIFCDPDLPEAGIDD